MSKFKVGDRVRCIDASLCFDLLLGEVYTVIKVCALYVYLDELDHEAGWRFSRFHLDHAAPEKPGTPQPQPDSRMSAFTAVHDAIAPLSSLDRCKVIHAVKALLGMT